MKTPVHFAGPVFARRPKRPVAVRIFCLGLLPALLLVCAGAAAQSALDGFDPDVNGQVEVMVVQPDGRILLGGSFTQVGG